jgi:site-specific DNA-adenine methylase
MGKNFQQDTEKIILKKIKKSFNQSKDKLLIDNVFIILN